MDVIGVKLAQDQKRRVLMAVENYIWLTRTYDREGVQILEEIKLHLENNDSNLVFVENMAPRFDLDEHLDLLDV
jgi:hypothetical protein